QPMERAILRNSVNRRYSGTKNPEMFGEAFTVKEPSVAPAIGVMSRTPPKLNLKVPTPEVIPITDVPDLLKMGGSWLLTFEFRRSRLVKVPCALIAPSKLVKSY